MSPQSVNLVISQTQQLTSTALDSAGNLLVEPIVVWRSSNPSIATVSKTGLVTGTSTGYATITAAISGKLATASIAVTSSPVASVTISPQSVRLITHQTQQLTSTTMDSTGKLLADSVVIWESSNPSAATASNSGLVTAIAPGFTTITCNVDGLVGTALITITSTPVASVKIIPAIVVIVASNTHTMIATLKNAGGGKIKELTIAWSSSDTSVATVTSTGMVTGKIPGLATITATSQGLSGQATVAVVDPYL